MEDEGENESAGMVVSVRVKPLDPGEQSVSVRSVDTNMVCISQGDASHTYKFDFVHWSTGSSRDVPGYASQEAVFNDVGAPLVSNAIRGFNCTLFAYGQTGSGKTYTMLGEQGNEGVIPRVCRSLMTSKVEEGTVVTFTITYVEIFLERVRDLLRAPPTRPGAQTQSLKVREHPADGPFVEGATVVEVEDFEECMAYMEVGSRHRQVASTKMNQQSSRSHAIFTLQCTQTKPLDQLQTDGNIDEGEVYTVVSKINLVDLAGSENALSAGSTGNRLKEGAAINKSLLTLGRVIKTLAENSSKRESGGSRRSSTGTRRASMFELSSTSRSSGGQGRERLSLSGAEKDAERPALIVPYRDSVLTYLLKESLGGNSKTTMIAAVRPGMSFADETANTLRYAAQAKKIVNVVVVNENPYVKMIKKLQQEVEDLTKMLQAATAAAPVPRTPESAPVPSSPLPSAEAISSLQMKLQMVQQSSMAALHSYERHSSPVKRRGQTPRRGPLSTDKDDCDTQRCTPTALLLEGEGEGEGKGRKLLDEEAPYRVAFSHADSDDDDVGSVDGNVEEAPDKVPNSGDVSCMAQDQELVSTIQRNMDEGDSVSRAPEVVRRDRERKGPLSAVKSNPPVRDNQLSPVVVLYSRHDDTGPCDTGSTNRSSSSSEESCSGGGGTGSGGRVSIESDPGAPVLKEGFLMKRGFVNTAFQRRWCVLRGRDIVFYRRYKDKRARGTINCDGARVTPAVEKEDLPFAFYLYTPKDRYHKKWLLQAASEDEMISWINAIKIAAVHFERQDTEEEQVCSVS